MKQLGRPCVIWGATGQAKVAYDILRDEDVQIMHFFDNNTNLKSPLLEIPISHGHIGLLAFIDSLKDQQLKPSDIDCIAAVGGSHGEARETITLIA